MTPCAVILNYGFSPALGGAKRRSPRGSPALSSPFPHPKPFSVLPKFPPVVEPSPLNVLKEVVGLGSSKQEIALVAHPVANQRGVTRAPLEMKEGLPSLTHPHSSTILHDDAFGCCLEREQKDPVSSGPLPSCSDYIVAGSATGSLWVVNETGRCFDDCRLGPNMGLPFCGNRHDHHYQHHY